MKGIKNGKGPASALFIEEVDRPTPKGFIPISIIELMHRWSSLSQGTECKGKVDSDRLKLLA